LPSRNCSTAHSTTLPSSCVARSSRIEHPTYQILCQISIISRKSGASINIFYHADLVVTLLSSSNAFYMVKTTTSPTPSFSRRSSNQGVHYRTITLMLHIWRSATSLLTLRLCKSTSHHSMGCQRTQTPGYTAHVLPLSRHSIDTDGAMTNYKKQVLHDCLVPREKYQALYLVMRERHKHLVDTWKEVTDLLNTSSR